MILVGQKDQWERCIAIKKTKTPSKADIENLEKHSRKNQGHDKLRTKLRHDFETVKKGTVPYPTNCCWAFDLEKF